MLWSRREVGGEGSTRIGDAEFEQRYSKELSDQARRGKLRDVITARYVCLELNEMLFAELNARHLTLDDVSAEIRKRHGGWR